MKHEITFATPSDAKELLAIYAPYVKNTTVTFEYEVPSEEEFMHRIQTISKTFPYLVYKIDGKIAGYAYASTFKIRAAFMWDVETSIYLSEEFHSKNIAYKLYETLFTLLKEQGFYNCYAYITVPNPKSTKFHEKFGFKEIAFYENSGFKFDKWCSLCCMHMPLLKMENNKAPIPYKTIHELIPSFIASTLQMTQ